MSRITWIAPDDHDSAFPDVEMALLEPNGLLAVGGPLSAERLERAYRSGVFPWFSAGQPVLWWSPNPRAVIYPERLHISRSLRKRVRQGDYTVTLDTAFRRVMESCAAPRADQAGTWITTEMIEAYADLHFRGLAHSAEVWIDSELVGGLYGVSLGAAFFGESMFSRVTDASKLALVSLVSRLRTWGFHFIDCQLPTRHLASLGAVEVPRPRFIRELAAALVVPTRRGRWSAGNADDLGITRGA